MDSDEALFEAVVGGDMRAFDRLYERYERPLMAFIRAQLREPSEAEDVLHEAFMAVLRQRGQRHEIRSFRAWIYQVARHACLNRARDRRRAGRALESLAHDESGATHGFSAEHALELEQIGARLAAAIARLPAPLSEMYRLRAAGMSYDELAQTLELPLGTVKSRMHEMVSRLREEMKR